MREPSPPTAAERFVATVLGLILAALIIAVSCAVPFALGYGIAWMLDAGREVTWGFVALLGVSLVRIAMWNGDEAK